jgi:hypothetical protein
MQTASKPNHSAWERNMNTPTSTGNGTNTAIATIANVVREARRKAESAGAQSDLAKWLIIAAAIFGALMLMRIMRRVSGIAIGLFWVWFWTHGAWRWIF